MKPLSYFDQDSPESMYAPDGPFNRANAPTVIGRHFSTRTVPSYCQVRRSTLPPVEYLLAQQDVLVAQACLKIAQLVEGVRKI